MNFVDFGLYEARGSRDEGVPIVQSPSGALHIAYWTLTYSVVLILKPLTDWTHPETQLLD
jgi:hypothetical protein